MKRKLLSTIILVALLFSVSIVNANADEYEAVARGAGEFLYQLELIKGDGSGDLKVNNLLSREESVILTLRMLRLEEQAKNYSRTGDFSDVPADLWSAPYINFAKANNLVNGLGNGQFGPKQNVTIKQLITIFLRAAKYSADWQSEDIWEKGRIFGLTTELDPSITENQFASRGDAFIIFAKAITLPLNPEQVKDSCVLVQVFEEDPNLMSIAEEYGFVEKYYPNQYTPNYDFLELYAGGDDTPDSNSDDDDDGNTEPKPNEDNVPDDPKPEVPEVNLEFIKAEPGYAINVMNLFFNELLDYNEMDGAVTVTDVTGDFGDYNSSWFLDSANYTVGTTDKKVYVRYNDGGSSVDLAGLTFYLKYDIKARESDDRATGTTSVTFDGSNQSNTPNTLAFVKAEPGDAINVMNLFFNELLDYNEMDGAVTVTDVTGDFGDYDSAWFLDSANYTVGTTDKKVYVRYNDGGSSVDLAGLTFYLEYDVKARESDDRVTGTTSVEFEGSGQDNTSSAFEFVKAEPGDAINVMNLFFNQLVDYNDISGAVTVTDVTGDFGDYDGAWFLDKANYTVGTTDKKVYVRYNDGGSSVDLAGLTFYLEYNVKARESDETVNGTVEIQF